MIDIHCHLLYGVDDGPDTLEESLKMLEIAKEQGIKIIILTPHYRHGMFKYPMESINKHAVPLFEKSFDLGIKLCLGCEYHVDSDMIDNFNSTRTYTLNGTNYILTEYKETSEYSYIRANTVEAISNGYIPIIAHVERYKSIRKSLEHIQELKKLGALIQINADSVLGKDGFILKRFCHEILKNHLADFVASDSHNTTTRPNRMQEAYKFVASKYGSHYAKNIFELNAAYLFDKKTIEKMKAKNVLKKEETVERKDAKMDEQIEIASLEMMLPPVRTANKVKVDDIKLDFLDI